MMIFALCITSALNDLNLQKGRKKVHFYRFSYYDFANYPFTAFGVLSGYWLDRYCLYAGIAVFLFGVAWTPQLLNQWIARRLLRDEPMSGKQQVQIIEWIHFHPLKKLLIFGLWGFGVVLVLRGIWVTATGKIRNGRRAFPVFTWYSSSGCGAVSENETLYLRALPEHTGTESDSQQKTVGAAVGWRTL